VQIEHIRAAECLDFLLKVLEECQSCRTCPSLCESLALLPRPLLSPRPVLEGDRLMLWGTLPAAESLRRDPAGTVLDAEALQRLARAYLMLWGRAGKSVAPRCGRWELGRAIQRADGAARDALRAAGYTEEVVARTPAVNAAVLHALFVGEELLARRAAAAA